MFCLQGVSPEGLNKIGETWADVATQGICDFDLYARIAREYPKLADNPDELFEVEDPGVFTLADKAELIRVSTGFGDGTFNLYELLANGDRVGVEVELIRSDEEYPI